MNGSLAFLEGRQLDEAVSAMLHALSDVGRAVARILVERHAKVLGLVRDLDHPIGGGVLLDLHETFIAPLPMERDEDDALLAEDGVGMETSKASNHDVEGFAGLVAEGEALLGDRELVGDHLRTA